MGIDPLTRGVPPQAAPPVGDSDGGSPVARLALHNVTKSFGSVTVLKGVDLEVQAGEIHGLVGQNGAGKSTITRILAGGYPDYGGQIEIDGLDVHLATPRGARQQGIAVVYQELSLVSKMSVAENIMLGEESGRVLYNPSRQRKSAEDLLEEVGMAGEFRLDAIVGSLSAGVQQRVEIAKALTRKVKVLVLDEPTARLTGAERDQLIGLMHSISEGGTCIIFISHFLDEVLAVTSEVTVLRDGEVTAKGPTAGFSIDSLSVALVGRQLAQEIRSITTEKPEGAALLRATKLSGGRQVREVSLVLRSGEILGLAGLVGSGRSTLAHLLVGAQRPTGGSLEVRGEPVRLRSPRQALRLGIGLVAEDRRTQGLIVSSSAADNLVLMWLAKVRTRLGLVKPSELQRLARNAVTEFNVRPADARRPVSTFSGGNQQKVIIARAVIARPDILIFDQPTAGTDVGTTSEIHQILRNLTAEGKAILVISDDVHELVTLCNRLVVMHRGRVVSEPSPDIDTEELVKLMTVGVPVA
jgi:ABC-type sugar transport system ATPase subunit